MSSMAGSTRQAVLIAGMHRSGTSAVTRVLNLLGVALAPNLVPSFEGNELGHWEPAELPELHDRMLRDAGLNVNSVRALEPSWFESAAADSYADEIAAWIGTAFPSAPLFSIKDPRMSLVLPVWLRALQRLGVEARFVLPFRAPREVAASLNRRQLRVFTDSVWPDARGELIWLQYVLAAERATRGRPRAFLAYDALLDDWRGETARIAGQLGLVWPRTPDEAAGDIGAYLARDHKHESAEQPSVSRLAADVLQALHTAVADPNAGAEVFDAAARELDNAHVLYGGYVGALESLIGAVPALKTEFGDFPSPLDGAVRELPEDVERLQALLVAAAAERRAQAAVIRDLQAANTALADARRPAPVVSDRAHDGDIERLRREAAEALDAYTALQLKVAAQQARLHELEERLAEPGRERGGGVDAELRAVRAELEALRASTSWRITAPMRGLSARLSPRRS